MRASRYFICLFVIAVLAPCVIPPAPAQAQSDSELWEMDAAASKLSQEGRYAEALEITERMLPATVAGYGEFSHDTAAVLNNIASYNQYLGRLTVAIPYFERTIAILEKIGRNNVYMGSTLASLASVYGELGRYADAEPLYQRSIAILQKHRRSDPGSLTIAISGLGVLYDHMGRYPEAERLQRETLAIQEKMRGVGPADIAVTLNNLASPVESQNRIEEAEVLYLRALKLAHSALGDNHADMINRYNNLGEFYRKRHRPAEAEPLLKKALAVAEATYGPDNPNVAMASSNLAKLYSELKRFREGEQLYRRAMQITETAWGKEHPIYSARIYNLAVLYRDEGRFAEAEPLLLEALKLKEATALPNDPELAWNLEALADVEFAQNKWEAGLDHVRRAARIVTARAQRTPATASIGRDNLRAELEKGSGAFARVLKGAWHVSRMKPDEAAALSEEALQAHQWSTETAAAAALAMLAAREGSGDPQLAALVRERQDLTARWREIDSMLTAAAAADNEELRAELARLRAEHASIDKRIGALDAQIAGRFPNYSALATPTALSTQELQALLRPDEVVLQYSMVDDDALVWVITKERVLWELVTDRPAEMTPKLHNLQCGLDSSSWINGEQQCLKSGLTAFSAAESKAGRVPPFDLANAFALYKTLFGKIESLLKNADGSWRHLLIVPDPFFTLAFAALVTEDPNSTLFAKGADYHTAKWLGTRQPISILPSVASLKALRATAQQKPAPRPYIGFGNPLLAGNLAVSDHIERAKLAGEWQRCAEVKPTSTVVALRNVVPLFGESEIADVALLRAQLPLPETATELCDVGASFGIAASEMDDAVRLGSRATEADVKSMSDGGKLAEFRTVHFATHAALAGQVKGTAEPGLILTPPTQGTVADDGYLTASEIAQLKLNADWVILSACNTAGGSAQDSGALSGLARAFFYAGARSLLVSRWAVSSQAAVHLIRGTFGAIAADPSIGRAAALQVAMKKLVEGRGPEAAHPAYWAPFFVVGEGAQ